MQYWEEYWPNIYKNADSFRSRVYDFASSEKCQTVQVKHNDGNTMEEKDILALGDSAMYENQVELFYFMTVEAL